MLDFNKLEDLRKKKDISLVEMAKKVNLTPGYISNLEKGLKTNPTINVLEKIANVHEISLMELIQQLQISAKER